MDILNMIIYFIAAMIFVRIFQAAENFAEASNTSKSVISMSRFFVILVYTIAIISLSAYSILITEAGIFFRLLAGIIAILMFLHFIRVLKRYFKH